MDTAIAVGQAFVLERERFQDLIDALQAQGYTVLGPTVEAGAIVYGPLSRVEDLPIGWRDRQDGGFYRLERREEPTLFGYVVGPSSWKKFLHPPTVSLWKARRTSDGGFELVTETAPEEATPRHAFLGVRPCELHAIQIQDRVFLEGPFVDPVYRERRSRIFTVVVNCVEPGGTCFCASMDTGPWAEGGFDLALTELLDPEGHRFVVHVGSPEGAAVLEQVPLRPATDADLAQERARLDEATGRMGRSLDVHGLKERLYAQYEAPYWEEVAQRCLTCTNCTLVCPTCFCTTVEDVTDLGGEWAERRRVWDSCFTLAFSYIHGGSIRSSPAARYRQWLTHKLATWQDQFDTLGCVGCGRCITWCPVGIDITQEAARLVATAEAHGP